MDHQLNEKPFETLYNQYLALNERGRQIGEDVQDLLYPLYQRLYHAGVSPRELTGVIALETGLLEAELCLRHGLTKRKTERT